MKKWFEIEKEKILGWDFTEINKESESETLRWDYKRIVEDVISDEMVMLDMGTGGGEFLQSLKFIPKQTYATEQYEPNYLYVKDTLKSKGIHLDFTQNDQLPYDDETFDLILNRHESFDPVEVYRTLKSGGLFITQQVGSQNTYEFATWLLGDVRDDPDGFTLNSTQESLEDVGFILLESDEQFLNYRFFSVDAFVRFARIIEWEFPGFSVKESYDKLLFLQKEITTKGYFSMKEHRFYMVLKKG